MQQMVDGVLVDMTAEEVAALEAERNRAPAEVAMHKVLKAAYLTPWPGYANLEEAIYAGVAALPAPKNELARRELDRAQNLVRDGVTTASVMFILGMTEEERDTLLRFAASLP